jgi:hypothetical protein
MPSPVGHAIAGAAAGLTVAAGRHARAAAAPGRRLSTHLIWFAVLGMLPDADLLFGAHSGPTHGLGAALVAGLAAGALTRAAATGVAAGAAYASHILLDWLGSDTSPPLGIMALWPFSRAHYESSLHVFHAISRRYWTPEFWDANLRALGWELLVLLPLLGAALVRWRRHSPPTHHGADRARSG